MCLHRFVGQQNFLLGLNQGFFQFHYMRFALDLDNQGYFKRCRLSWLTNSVLAYEPNCGGRGGVAGSQPMSTAVHMAPKYVNFGDLTP